MDQKGPTEGPLHPQCCLATLTPPPPTPVLAPHTPFSNAFQRLEKVGSQQPGFRALFSKQLPLASLSCSIKPKGLFQGPQRLSPGSVPLPTSCLPGPKSGPGCGVPSLAPFLCPLQHLQSSPTTSLPLDVLSQIRQSVVAQSSGLLDVSPNGLHLEESKRIPSPLLHSLSINLNLSLSLSEYPTKYFFSNFTVHACYLGAL